MNLVQPEHNVHYYEAYHDGALIGYWPNEDKLIFADWLDDMNNIAIFGCTHLEHLAKLKRLADLAKGIKLRQTDYKIIDRRKKYE